jgi:alpha-L-fucosidase 2
VKSFLRCFFLLVTGCAWGGTETLVWFNALARKFSESCPLGNGRLGARMFGEMNEERFVLNESSLWSGSKQDADQPNAAKALPEIRRLLLAGKNAEAERLVNANFSSKGVGSNRGHGGSVPYGSYEVLGNLQLSFSGASTNPLITGYRRELDLAEAVARVEFTRDGVAFRREAFARLPAASPKVR